LECLTERMVSISKRWCKVGVLLALAVALWFAHSWLLSVGVARPLIADDPPADAQYLCLRGDEFGFDGEDCLDQAATWRRATPAGRILLLEPWPRRIVDIGILPSFEQTARRELGQRGVADDAVVLVRGRAKDEWEEARLLQTWLQERPEASIVVLCSRFQSGQRRYVLDTVLAPADARRVAVRGLADPRYDETNWWKSRSGVKAVMFGWLRLIYAWGRGEDRDVPRRYTADEYQTLLKTTFGEAP
jgi:hypothetical protein